jgi:hypothetical protein
MQQKKIKQLTCWGDYPLGLSSHLTSVPATTKKLKIEDSICLLFSAELHGEGVS